MVKRDIADVETAGSCPVVRSMKYSFALGMFVGHLLDNHDDLHKGLIVGGISSVIFLAGIFLIDFISDFIEKSRNNDVKSN